MLAFVIIILVATAGFFLAEKLASNGLIGLAIGVVVGVIVVALATEFAELDKKSKKFAKLHSEVEAEAK